VPLDVAREKLIAVVLGFGKSVDAKLDKMPQAGGGSYSGHATAFRLNAPTPAARLR
jgi:hypothetical protein